MSGFIVYSWPRHLSECWEIPIAHVGCTIRPSPSGGVVEYCGAKVRLLIGRSGDATIYGWSFPWTNRYALSQIVELTLLASGMQAYCKPHSTDLIYVVNDAAGPAVLDRVVERQDDIDVKYGTRRKIDPPHHRRGWLKVGSGPRIRFWTGPAVDPATRGLRSFIAIGAEAAALVGNGQDPFVSRLDVAIRSAGAQRVQVRRELDH